jgi:hypothetical protein
MTESIRPDDSAPTTLEAPHFDPRSLILPGESKRESVYETLFALLVVSYFASFFLPISFSSKEGQGYQLFFVGLWLIVYSLISFPYTGFASLPLILCWLANPLFWRGAVLIARPDRASRLRGGLYGLLATGAASIWLLLPAPAPYMPGMYGPAYWCWLSSCIAVAVVGLLRGVSTPAWTYRPFNSRPDRELDRLYRLIESEQSSSPNGASPPTPRAGGDPDEGFCRSPRDIAQRT